MTSTPRFERTRVPPSEPRSTQLPRTALPCAAHRTRRWVVRPVRSQTPFDAPAVDALYELSRGNMRAIDQLALKSLQAAARAGADAASSSHILAARKDLWL